MRVGQALSLMLVHDGVTAAAKAVCVLAVTLWYYSCSNYNTINTL